MDSWLYIRIDGRMDGWVDVLYIIIIPRLLFVFATYCIIAPTYSMYILGTLPMCLHDVDIGMIVIPSILYVCRGLYL